MKQKLNVTKLVIFFAVISLVVFGIVMIYSASSYSASQNYGDALYFVKKQIVGAVIGLVGMIVFMFINLDKLKKLKWVVLIFSVLSLILVFVPGIGKSTLGATRWIKIAGLSIQPSEIAKFGFVFFSAAQFSDMTKDPKSLKTILPVVFSGGLICLLIIMEPNMSITICVGLTMLVMLFVGGCSIKNFLLILIPIIALVPVLIIIEPYRLQRLSAFLDPWSSPLEEGFQLIQSYYALGSGGLGGVGFGNSRQKYLFLPFAESDFIFSIIGEEFGFVVCLAIFAIYLLIIVLGFKLAVRETSRFKCYLILGVISLIAIQTLLNIAVCTGLIPPTGLPLPFISAGSTSLLVFMSAVGVVLNINRQSQK